MAKYGHVRKFAEAEAEQDALLDPGVDSPASGGVGVGFGGAKRARFEGVAEFVESGKGVIDARTLKVEKYLLVGQRVWQMAFTPDDKYLLTTNGLSNDVSVIDVADLKVIKSIQVGRLPWGVAVAAQ